MAPKHVETQGLACRISLANLEGFTAQRVQSGGRQLTTRTHGCFPSGPSVHLGECRHSAAVHTAWEPTKTATPQETGHAGHAGAPAPSCPWHKVRGKPRAGGPEGRGQARQEQHEHTVCLRYNPPTQTAPEDEDTGPHMIDPGHQDQTLPPT